MVLTFVQIIAAGGDTTIANRAVTDFVRSSALGIPMPFVILLVGWRPGALFVNRTPYGRAAAGGRAEPPRGAPGRHRRRSDDLAGYIICGVLAGLTGMLLAASVGSADLELGNPFLLTSVGAVVLGGNRISGGTASVAGTCLGACLLTLLVLAVTVAGLPIEAKNIASGLVITVVLVAANAPKRGRAPVDAPQSFPKRRPWAARQSDLTERVAIVTGAAGGLGRATVELFLRLGASVVAEDIDAAVQGLGGERVVAVRGDVRERATAEAAVGRALERFGRLDILVNNAAVILSKDILETADAEWDEVMAVNVKGAFHHVRAACQSCSSGGGGRSST